MRRRSLQIASNIQRELQNRLARGLADPRIKGMVTVTRVELSDDLKHAKAFISVMPEQHAKITMHGLISASRRLRKDVMSRIHIKEMPTLQLVYDEGHKAQMEVMALLARDRRERGIEELPAADPSPEHASDQTSEPSPDQTSAKPEDPSVDSPGDQAGGAVT